MRKLAGTVNAPADVRENVVLEQLLAADKVQPVAAARSWLGAPNSIKGPTEVAFRRLSGNNLLVVGQREETALSLFGIALIAFTDTSVLSRVFADRHDHRVSGDDEMRAIADKAVDEIVSRIVTS